MPGEQLVLAEIRARRQEGLAWEAVAEHLNAAGLRPRSAACWSARNVGKVALKIA